MDIFSFLGNFVHKYISMIQKRCTLVAILKSSQIKTQMTKRTLQVYYTIYIPCSLLVMETIYRILGIVSFCCYHFISVPKLNVLTKIISLLIPSYSHYTLNLTHRINIVYIRAHQHPHTHAHTYSKL